MGVGKLILKGFFGRGSFGQDLEAEAGFQLVKLGLTGRKFHQEKEKATEKGSV
jgi:hypothetical protein